MFRGPKSIIFVFLQYIVISLGVASSAISTKCIIGEDLYLTLTNLTTSIKNRGCANTEPCGTSDLVFNSIHTTKDNDT